ncbi:Outer membrane efflux protein [Mariprofundus aestuarium]|uniref:Outer membrane efflux protein n=1 Tax=Mariprofundus aestuarium TaxID=1921086 RepID=A0A2K8KW71_MARES|nr:TolC family protein [Mariprofundus aestuarium]ATX79097.1 Outer membrane efflux protein [Mariprofundus aestuarium]
MNPSFNRIIVTTLLLSAWAMPAAAEEMDLKTAIERVISSHPDLDVSLIDRQIAQTDSRRVEGMLDPVVTARIGASEETVPTSSSFQPSETRLGQLSASIAKPLASGGTLGANFNYIRTSQAYPPSPLAAQLSSFNPAYRNQINLNYRHPLLKGSDRPDYSQSLIASEAGVRAANMQQLVTARILALKATNAWFQLASDDINIRIADQAVQRANELLNYQQVREKFGLIETADRLQAEALLAGRKTDLQRARARRASSLNNLNMLMRRAPESAIDIRIEATDERTAPEMHTAMAIAEQKRAELKLLKAQMDAAEAQLMIARDGDNMKLNLVAEVGTRALDTSAAGAAAGGLSANDHYASLSVELSEVLGRNSARATMAKAELQRQRVNAQLRSTMEQIRSDLATAITALRNGKPTLLAARKQSEAEKRKFRAEMKRYREGRSDTATLVQFEGELARAELNADLQALTLQLASRQLLWAQGNLLESLHIDIANSHGQ